MANLNKVLLMGRLTRDPELRYTAGGQAVADIALAVNERWKDGDGKQKERVVYVDCTVWGRTAENCGEYLKKGSGVFIEGRLQLDQWEDNKTGAKRSKLKVTATSVQFLDGRSDGGSQREPAKAGAVDDEDVPF